MSLGQISYQSELHDRGTYASGVGCRVVRGPDWKWGKQDGGEGHLGSVRRFDTVGEAIVVWDSGIVANYRCGTLGFDLRVLDSAPTGVEHPGTICEGCHESPIYGTRWKCVVCLSTDLCSTCYHSDKHSLTHQFLRITAPYKTRVIVGRRLKQRRVEALGLFPKARVVRGIDWSWGNQDCVSPLTSSGSSSLLLGASGSALSCRALVRANGEDTSAGPILLPTQGRVTDRRDWYPGAPRSAALVAWDSGAYNVYRVGYAGMVDLKAVRPAKGGSYYVDHLPLLADLRDWNSNESGRGLEEVTVSCAVDEDVADLCRDACGNPLVPNWTNLQELESRRRKTIGSSLGTDTQRYRHTAQSTRQSSRSEVVTHSGSHEHNSSVPQRISSGSAIPQEPAASSCLNVCTLASRLQLQSGTVESYAANHSIISRPPVAGTSRSRPNQVSFAQERDSDDTCVLRTSTAAPSGGLRNLGQTARSLITDLLRSNTSGPVVQSVSSSAATVRRAPESTGQTRTHTGIRSAVTSPPTSRIQNPCVRQEEQINRTTEHSSASTSSRSSRTRDVSGSHHAQRRETTTDERSRLVTLIPRAVVGIHADSVTREGGCAHTDPVELIDSNEPFSHTSSHTAGHRREPGSRMVYGVYNQLHGMVPDSGAPNSGQLGVGTDTDPMEAERRNFVYKIPDCQRNHCRGQVGQSNEDLIRAAEEGNVKRLKCLLQHRHVNVDSKFAGVTALHVACQMGNVACVAVLLQFGAKRRLRDGSGNEAIHAAAQGGNVGIVRLLLSTRARHRLFGIPGVSTLDDGVIIESEESGSRDAAETFPDEDDVPDVNSRNALRQTALHLSVTRHDFMVAQCLLEEFNALPNLQTNHCSSIGRDWPVYAMEKYMNTLVG
ncbi:E3 ubiquitin-protein ligase MIB2 [Fasciola hepatica]|uniref:E3 ubiquitin-protein ligase MIB2 n=1 Tax=Fasciola hepatica TaxID=6192 RepID=A0A4E0RK46_FASHE|nr:E3 ubiquitin-protein ligase MIB2 [Fasciola hepatica]